MTSDLAVALSPAAEHIDIARLEGLADQADPQSRRELVMYVREAVFFHRVLAPDIERLEPDSLVLEIGSGIGLLARLIAARGHRVVGFEPAAAGFGEMQQWSEQIGECWRGGRGDVTVIPTVFEAERLTGMQFDLVLAVNVIEHIADPAGIVAATSAHLSDGGRGRFICPNYVFPYEPHFGFPTLVNKRATGVVMRRRIARSRLRDPEQFWNELSWPSMGSLGRSLRERGVGHQFCRGALTAYADRTGENDFVDRKGALFKLLAGSLRPAFRFAIRSTPLRIAPVLDLTTFAPGSLPQGATPRV